MKNVTILVLGMMITQLSFAQGEFKFGLKGVANIGFLSGTNKTIVNDGSTLAFGYGIMGDYFFKPNYGVHGEILMSSVKSKFTLTSPQVFNKASGDTLVDLRYEYNVQYLELPVSLKFKTKDIGNMSYYGDFGFAPGFVIKAKASIVSSNLPAAVADLDPLDYNVNDAEGDNYTTDNFDDKVFLFRFPLIIGGGVEYALAGSTKLQGGVRFANSFTDMFLKDKIASAKNSYVSISLGVLF